MFSFVQLSSVVIARELHLELMETGLGSRGSSGEAGWGLVISPRGAESDGVRERARELRLVRGKTAPAVRSAWVSSPSERESMLFNEGDDAPSRLHPQTSELGRGNEGFDLPISSQDEAWRRGVGIDFSNEG